MGMQLFCFPFAGGSSDFFSPLEAYISSGIHLVKMDYPGHGTRRGEALLQDFRTLADDMYQRVKVSLTGEPYALFGYSMGCVVVAELVRYIAAVNEIPQPKHVFLAAYEPRTRRELIGIDSAVSDDLIKERTIQLGGIPKRLIDNHTFWRVYLPIYRADYSMVSRYDFDSLSIHTDIPATLFYSPTDTPRAKMNGWRRYFTGICEFREYSGTHFFLRQHYSEIAADVNCRLESKYDI